MSNIAIQKVWNSNDTPVNSDLNLNFSILYNDYNGNITDFNIAPTAAIQPNKILNTAFTLTGAGTQNVTQTSTFNEGKLLQLIGTGGTAPQYGQTLFAATVSVQSAGNGSTLQTTVLPTNTITTTPRGIKIRAWGTKASTTNAATVQITFGGQVVASKILPATAVGVANWYLEAIVMRTSASHQLFYGEGRHNQGTSVAGADAALVFFANTNGTLTITETATITVSGVASTASTTEVTQLGMLIEAI